MSQSRRRFLQTLGYGAAATTLPSWMLRCGRSDDRPNILFIMSDDHAQRAISCYESRFINTPNIDRIAREGMRFKNSFVTNSICAPSRAAILTGKLSHENGLRDNRDEFNSTQPTFPKMLQAAGYQTLLVGKWHLKSRPTGFDHWQILKGQGQYYNPDFIEGGETSQFTGYTTDIITDLAIESLEQRNSRQPFCLLVHHKAPHRNWMPDVQHLPEFEEQDFPLPATLFDDYSTREETAGVADMRIEDMYLSFDLKLHKKYYGEETGTGGNETYAEQVEETWKQTYARFTEAQKKAWDNHYNPVNEQFKNTSMSGNELTIWKYQRYLTDYLACVRSVDNSVGELLKYLDDNGLAENTIVIYTSDQGFYLGEHGWYDKRFMYEESLRTPLVIRYPREITPGSETSSLVKNIDITPTILDYADRDIPKDMQGASLRVLTGTTTPDHWRDSIYYHYYEYPHGWHDVKRHYGVRTDRYKLIHFYHSIDRWELYDLKVDPNELKNVYSDPEYARIVESLKGKLAKLQHQYGDSTAMQWQHDTPLEMNK